MGICGSVAPDISSATSTTGNQRTPLTISNASMTPVDGFHGVMLTACSGSIKLIRSKTR